MLNRTVVNGYFDALERMVNEHGVTKKENLELRWNFEHTTGRVVTVRGARSVVGKTSQKSSNITIIACVSASGAAIPPLIITKGKTPKSLYGYKTKRWFGMELPRKGLDYWRDRRTTIFLKQCGSKRPQLFIFDGHSSHVTLAIIERAIEEDIALLSLPPHCTQYLQPLDRTVFGSLKKIYNSSCAQYLSVYPLHVINKWTFPLPLRQAWDLQKSTSEAG